MTPPRSRQKPATIHDVARLAELSKSTVSNVIRGAPGVNPETKERVEKAIQALGYRPNVVARQLVQQRTTVLGIVIGDLGNPFYAEMAKLIEGFAAARGFQLMFCNTQVDEHTELKGIRSLIEHRVAGLLFLAYAGDADGARLAVGDQLPVVFVTCDADWGDVVAVDDLAAATAATRHLIELGHQRIIYFADTVREARAESARRDGYLAAINEAGLAPRVLRWHERPRLVRNDDGIRSMEAILAGPDRPTAIFAANDLHAMDILDCADQYGLRVPEDLSIIGFDDIAISRIARISLSTIAQPKEQLARIAVELLIGRIRGDIQGRAMRHSLDFSLLKRRTTARAPHP
ncbi:MAG TPA: LacI family DNA-binding transcriptional regulator [Acidisoma sp.]|jgi:DNA-binding LacI/PurR family transcriptional regulator|uniref:LacI family DNA-binding transcriptional regulator n=1 Tax=Acidisoma sp. TaxID=1872115 RepID=UPI002BB1893B|nr:LacI family DNA-binding transcriptional regulator [Acidisoma sp.]HTH99599.1 LacI family DNA-binding transcriptional regulator [Acidisoma sp.]